MAQWEGSLVGIYIAEAELTPMVALGEAEVVARRGIVGDRYFTHQGFWSDHPYVCEVTLFEMETCEAIRREMGVDLAPDALRRNFITRDVPLNHLVEREFLVGNVRLYGQKLCEPCGHIVQVTFPAVRNALLHRGGLRAMVVSGGSVRVGDVIRPA